MRGRASFLDVRQHGVRARVGPIGVAFVPRGDDQPVQVAYAVGRRVGNAVTRNRLRRQLRAALSEVARHGDITLRGGRYVITPSPAARHRSFAQLRTTLASALDRACGLADAASTAP